MASREKEEKLSLVLTLFKGENFVCKEPGVRCKIEAKCCDEVLRSGFFPISSTNTEPAFNVQLAWQFSRRQLKDLRANKTAIKVRCLLLNDISKHHTELGYTVLHIKDAFPWSGGDVEASKAHSYPLLGTKEQWKNYHPKLLMQLHIEDYSVEQLTTSPNVQRKVIDEKKVNISNKTKVSPEKPRFENIESIDKTPRVDVISEIQNSVDKFTWRISETDGCFQLGEPADGDDLYIFNITIISAHNLQFLWNGRSPKKPAEADNYVWQIRYKAYGCEIKSDPFVLSTSDPSRRTFIGDKATARIRASAPYFYDYIQETAVEFHVIRFELSSSQDLINEEVMGVSFAELKDLAEADITELRTTLDIVSEWGYPNTIIPGEKPEVRTVFQLEATPGFFNTVKRLSPPVPSITLKPKDIAENKVIQTEENFIDLSKGKNVDATNGFFNTMKTTPPQSPQSPEKGKDINENKTSQTEEDCTDLSEGENVDATSRPYPTAKSVPPPIPSISQKGQGVDENRIFQTEEHCTDLSEGEDVEATHGFYPTAKSAPPPISRKGKSTNENRTSQTEDYTNLSEGENVDDTRGFFNTAKSVPPPIPSTSRRSKYTNENKITQIEECTDLSAGENLYVPPAMVFQTTDDLRTWKAEKKTAFKHKLQAKERAYLNILAQEAASRDTQREKLMADKLANLSKKEKEVRQLSAGILDREERVKKKELELFELNQKINLDSTATLENAKLSILRMQEEHKIEASHPLRNQEFEAELKKCKGKLEILELKLEEKEDYINKLKMERYERPESRIVEKLKLLEQENKLLKRQVIEVERSRDQYKKQSQSLCVKLSRLQEERDAQLKDENEALRLQIFANKQHKEMKKERKVLVDCSRQIRSMQDHRPPATAPENKKGASARSEKNHESTKKEPQHQTDETLTNEEEIQRLTQMRSGMLHTGAYTKYDMVIKEIEKRIVGLAEGKIVK
ncbi:hypothetical protein Fcan01_07816 [Folsomia candida]|uniref:DUF3668 domain-containing protein n=1 Tax=Folsomia candida TaxID=158441 RepID=A0A226EP93_FOLCA|nr:hypothetical protein Fcan01_07816 [Folsomia candida]